MDAKEFAIKSAIADLNAGIYKSLRAAAKAYGLPPTTLHNRYNGITTRAISHQFQQRLMPPQEEFLVEWILEEC